MSRNVNTVGHILVVSLGSVAVLWLFYLGVVDDSVLLLVFSGYFMVAVVVFYLLMIGLEHAHQRRLDRMERERM